MQHINYIQSVDPTCMLESVANDMYVIHINIIMCVQLVHPGYIIMFISYCSQDLGEIIAI